MATACRRCEGDLTLVGQYRVELKQVKPVDSKEAYSVVVDDLCYLCARAVEYYAKGEPIPENAFGLQRHEVYVREIQRTKAEEEA